MDKFRLVLCVIALAVVLAVCGSKEDKSIPMPEPVQGDSVACELVLEYDSTDASYTAYVLVTPPILVQQIVIESDSGRVVAKPSYSAVSTLDDGTMVFFTQGVMHGGLLKRVMSSATAMLVLESSYSTVQLPLDSAKVAFLRQGITH